MVCRTGYIPKTTTQNQIPVHPPNVTRDSKLSKILRDNMVEELKLRCDPSDLEEKRNIF